MPSSQQAKPQIGAFVLIKTKSVRNERQAQRVKEQAERLAKDEQQRQEKERAEQRKKSFIEMFESLDEQYQEQVLDEVVKNFANNIFSKWFKEAREQGVAHKDPKFIGKFYELFGW